MAGALGDDYRARNAAAGVRFPWNGGGAEQTSGQGMAAWVITNGRLCAYFMPLLAVELIFNLLHLVPAQRNAAVIEAYIAWNYTTWLKLAFLILAAVLLAPVCHLRRAALAHDDGRQPRPHHPPRWP
jgi:hypothetical protein